MSEAEGRRWDFDARAIHAEAAAWIERRESTSWTEAEKLTFEAWLSASPAHMVAFLRADDVWRRANRLRALSQSMQRASTNSISGSKRFRFGVAAAVLIAAGILGVQFSPRQSSTLYTTPIGGRETLALGDGSRIELNTNTAVRVLSTREERKVWLERGEAYFDIKHDASRPFVVVAGSRRIVDLGTKFLARARSSELDVTLIEGSARVEALGTAAKKYTKVLKPGDVAVATDEAVSVTRKSNPAVTRELSWRQGVLIFDATPLADAIADFNRYNKRQLVIADNGLAMKKIDGTFRANDEEAFLQVIHDLIGLQIKRTDNATTISRGSR